MKRDINGNTLIVLGNGFDLYCELPSDYLSYFHDRERQNDVKTLLSSISEVSRELMFYKSVLDNCFEKEENWNVWEIMFFVLKALSINGRNEWSYVEDIIKGSLDNSSSIFKWKTVFESHISRKYKPQSIDKSFAEAIVAQILCKHVKGIERIAKNREEYINYLLDQLKQFEITFGKYINEVSKKGSYIDKAKATLRQLSAGISCQIESFNYTLPNNISIEYVQGSEKAFDKCNIPILHLNGNTDCPVFGIGSNDINIDRDIFLFTKIYRNMDRPVTEDCADVGINEAIIFGHSLNEQDYPYFFSLFDILGYDGKNKYLPITFLYSRRIGDMSEQEVRTITLKKVIKLFGEYEANHLKLTQNNGTLITSLKHQNLIKIVSIQEAYKLK